MWLPAVAQVLCAVLFVGCAWLGSRSLEGPLALACLFLGISATKELVFMVPYSARCVGIGSLRFATPVIFSLVLFLAAYVCTKALGQMWPAHSWLGLVCTGMAVTLPYAVTAWLLATHEDRADVISMVKSTGVRRWLFGIAHSGK
jgi:hypothetical protein